MNILLVDEDAEANAALSAILKGAGHQVRTVVSGSHALSVALTHDFDAMICDMTLPDMSGEEIIRAIKAQAPQIPVVAITRVRTDEAQKVCEDAGAAALFEKPVPEELILTEIALIQKARLSLRVALVDRDRIHRTRLTKTLAAMGCTIEAYSSASEALAVIASDHAPGLWVADATDPDIFKLLSGVKTAHVPVFVFAGHNEAGHEENLMRAGAALFLAKPIDIDTLLTQASFLTR